MSAKRVMDDHLELANIGTNTHAQIDTHIADSTIHQTKYTDADAVDAMGVKADGNPLHHDRATEWGATEHTAIGDSSPHHARYIDSEAIAAVLADDAYVKIAGDTMTGNLKIERIIPNVQLKSSALNHYMTFVFADSSGYVGTFVTYGRNHASNPGAMAFNSSIANVGTIVFTTRTGFTTYNRLRIENDGKINIYDNVLKNPKNHADASLSGTEKVVEIDIGGNPYYYKVSPTKT